MRIALLTGLVACTLIFALGSEKTSALHLESFDAIDNQSEGVGTLLAAADTNIDVKSTATQPAKEEIVEEPQEIKYTVEKNESLSKIAEKHDSTWKKIYDKNIAIENPDLINPGDVLVIPTKEEEVVARELPVVEEPVVVAKAPVQKSVSKRSTARPVAQKPAPAQQRQVARGNSSGNLYTAGNCTWYAKRMRPDMPNNLGNASTWVARAAAQGMAIGSTPRVGSIAQRNNHVAYVTGVNGDGTINISEMNYRSLYAVTYRTVPANQWLFIY